MNTVTQVDPHWLAELGSAFFSIKERGGLSGAARAKRSGDLDRATILEEQMQRDREAKERSERESTRKSRGDAGAGDAAAIATPGATPFRSRARRFV